jgi:hypothetical protein
MIKCRQCNEYSSLGAEWAHTYALHLFCILFSKISPCDTKSIQLFVNFANVEDTTTASLGYFKRDNVRQR